MKQQIKFIESEEAFRKELIDFNRKSPIGLDLETTGLDCHLYEIRTIQISDSAKALVIDASKVSKTSLIELLGPLFKNSNQIKCLHNAKFDLKFIKYHLNLDVEGIFDSYLASVLIEAGIRKSKGWHGLGQVYERYCNEPLAKDEQKSDWSGELTREQIIYAGKDAACLLALREKLIPVLNTMGLIKVAKLEFDCIAAMVWLELSGFYLDFDQWTKVAEQNLIKADKEANLIYDLIAPYVEQQSLFGVPEINLDSTQQIKKYFTAAGIPMPDSTKEWVMEPIAKEYPLARHLLKYRGYHKAGKDFGSNFEEFISPMTGRIHASFMQIGAETGRNSCSSPNLQQVPSDAEHRNCFKAQNPDNILLSFDYSQIELRILADLAKDTNTIEAFKSGIDYHSAMAARSFKVPLDKVTSEQRTFAKRLSFGLVYGIGSRRFALQSGISEEEAEAIMKAYFKAVPNEKSWLDYQKQQVLRTRSARSFSGRLAKYEFDIQDWTSCGKAQRNAANFPMQAGSADILKRALKLVYDRTRKYKDLKLVNVVHDEINLEVKNSELDEVSNIVSTAMVEAGKDFLHEVEVKVDRKISTFWDKG